MNEPAKLDPKTNPIVGATKNENGPDIFDQLDVDMFFFNAMNEAAVAISVVNQPAVAQLFQNANNRIFLAFLGIDNSPPSCDASRTAPNVGTTSWAGQYESYIKAYIPARNSEIQTFR